MSSMPFSGMPDPVETTQVVDPPESATDIESFLQSLGADFEYAPTITVPPIADEAGSTPYGVDEHGNDIEEEPSEEPPSEDYVVVNGNKVPVSEVQRLLGFDNFLKSRPDVAARMAESIKPAAGFPAVPEQTATSTSSVIPTFTPPVPPESLDLEDPNIKFLWEQMVDVKRQAFETEQQSNLTVAQFKQQQFQATQRQADIDMRDAEAKFRHDHPNFTPDELKNLRTYAADTSNLTALMQRMPPTDALYRALEIAGYAHEDFRSKMLDTATTTPEPPSATRKRRLSQISSAPGSAPVGNEPVRARSDREVIQQFATELAESGFGR
jgi:hypothetical protein